MCTDLFEALRLAKDLRRPVLVYVVSGDPLDDCRTYARKFREDVLNNHKVIDCVTRNMIPVALNYAKVVDEGSPESILLLPLLRQAEIVQGMLIISPEGQLLGGYETSIPVHRFEKEAKVGRSARILPRSYSQIKLAIKRFGSIESRSISVAASNPFRGRGFRSDGSVCLAEYVRRRDRSNIESPIIGSLNLTRDEFDSFSPSSFSPSIFEPGQSWSAPDSITRKFCRCLSPMGFERSPKPGGSKTQC